MTDKNQIYKELKDWVQDRLIELDYERDDDSLQYQEAGENSEDPDYEICREALYKIQQDYFDVKEFLESLL